MLHVWKVPGLSVRCSIFCRALMAETGLQKVSHFWLPLLSSAVPLSFSFLFLLFFIHAFASYLISWRSFSVACTGDQLNCINQVPNVIVVMNDNSYVFNEMWSSHSTCAIVWLIKLDILGSTSLEQRTIQIPHLFGLVFFLSKCRVCVCCLYVCFTLDLLGPAIRSNCTHFLYINCTGLSKRSGRLTNVNNQKMCMTQQKLCIKIIKN